jgi:hypothetical protein
MPHICLHVPYICGWEPYCLNLTEKNTKKAGKRDGLEQAINFIKMGAEGIAWKPHVSTNQAPTSIQTLL